MRDRPVTSVVDCRASSGPPPRRATLARGRVAPILVWTLILGAGWIGMIQVWAPHIRQPQNQFVGNLAEAEHYLFSDEPVPRLVVGSSMVESLDELSGGRFAVLGMNGMSAREALAIVVRSGRIPDRVAVELNGLTAPCNEKFMTRLFSPVAHELRRHVLALRAEYQPASVAMTIAKNMFGRGGELRQPAGPAEEFVRGRIAALREKYRQPPDLETLRANLWAVRESASELERRGAKVIYFDYPVPRGLGDTVFHQERRRVSREVLGDRAAAFVLDGDEFGTTDGIHLTHEGQQAVARRLADLLEAGDQEQ